MAQTPLLPALSSVPPHLIQAVIRDAEHTADRVGAFLTTLGLQPPVRLPADFLLGLGAALRLLEWEQTGISLHLEVGLPPARQAMYDVVRVVTSPAEPATAERARSLAGRVMDLSVERFAWAGQVELNADVTLGEAEEELLLDALADFLWAHRPR
jgi:hypothetical protein